MKHKFFWQQIPNQIVTEVLCKYCDCNKLKYSGVVLDTEHAPFSDETLYSCIQVATLCGKECFVRVTHLDKKLVRMILDAGATGIIFSTVESLQQAKDIVEYCKYPPNGIRGQGLVRENAWGKKELGKANPILVAQIETLKGINCLECKYIIDAFDYFLIGPYDLSASIGIVGDFENMLYKDAINSIESIIPQEKIGYHIVKDIDKQLYENGYGKYNFLAFSTDILMLMSESNSIGDILTKEVFVS